MALVALALGGCGAPASDVEAAFLALHRPMVVGAADPTDRDALWDHLAESLRGPALTAAYVAAYTAGATRARDGVTVEVLRVDYDAVQVLALGATRADVDARWSVGGRVAHQGHEHLRVLRYEARYALEWAEDGWRIVGVATRDVRPATLGGGAFELVDGDRGGFVDPLDLPELGAAVERP